MAEPTAPGDLTSEGNPGTGANVCPVCNGSGIVDGRACPSCEGTGTIVEDRGGG